MRVFSNCHTHTIFSDGRATAEEMVLAALERGMRSLGFSDHSVQTFDQYYTMSPESERESFLEIQRLRDQYGEKIRIWHGVEQDTHGIVRREEYDYILLAQHYVEKGEMRCPVDSRPRREELFQFRDSVYGGDGAQMAADYFFLAGEAARVVRPDIFAHFDVIRVFNREGELYDARDARVLQAEEEALKKIAASGSMLELNTGGVARGYLSEPYPEWDFLPLWKEMGGRLIFGSDSHVPQFLQYDFDRCAMRLREMGFRSVWELGGPGEALFVEREL